MDNVLYHVLRYLSPYERSRLCTVSKDTYANIIDAGKQYIAALATPDADRRAGKFDSRDHKIVPKITKVISTINTYRK